MIAEEVSPGVWRQVALAGLGRLEDSDLDTLADAIAGLNEEDRLRAAGVLLDGASGEFHKRLTLIVSALVAQPDVGLAAVEALAPHWQRLDAATQERIVAKVEQPAGIEDTKRNAILALDKVRHQIDPALHARLISAFS